MARIGFLGVGAIAEAMVTAIAVNGHDIFLSERSKEVSDRLAAEYQNVSITRNEALAEECDVIIICLLADVARDVLPNLRFNKKQTVISVMADLSLNELHRLMPEAGDIYISIPLLAMALGGTPLPVFPEDKMGKVKAVFQDKVEIINCDTEIGLNAHFAATGALLPMLDMMSVIAEWLATYTKNPELAEKYVAGLFAAQCLSIAPEGKENIAHFQKGLSTPNGLNETLSKSLKNIDAAHALHEGLNSLRARLGLPLEI